MASLPMSTSAPNVLFPSTPKHIPLYCSVCPDHPRFSDVSHLLTHIASKGHLHHETQTKLRAHEDMSASIALQQYEQWYRDNSIETLLVERMRAKQVKEASRSRRQQVIAGKKSRRSAPGKLIKTEHGGLPEDFPQQFPILHDLFGPEDSNEMGDETFAGSDMLSLKGQVWPGMGKMDLANDEMKRTRNQRKPKSVVEKMRRASEGIEPTQVVMTSQFDVERVKGVYDDESPVSDIEETVTPRKTTRQRRRKSQPLAQLSVNVPRGNTRRATRGTSTAQGKSVERTFASGLEQIRTPSGPLRHSHDGLCDEIKKGAFRPEVYTTPLSAQPEQRFDPRERLLSLNPISSSTVMSTSSSTPDIPCRMITTDLNRARYHGSPYSGINGSSSIGSLGPRDITCIMSSAPVYPDETHVSFSAPVQYNSLDQENFRIPSQNSASSKQEEHPHGNREEAFSNGGQGLFINLNGASANPLFSHDRQFMNAFAQHLSAHALEPGVFSPTGQDLDFGQLPGNGRDQRHVGSNAVKLEPHSYEGLETQSSVDAKEEGSFGARTYWGAPNLETDIPLQRSIHHDGVNI